MKDHTVKFMLLMCGLCLYSCISPVETGIRCYHIKDLQNSEEFFAFEEPLTCVPLETNKDGLIGYISKIVLTSGYIFIHSDNSLYQFDVNGKFIRQIGQTGKGPGEYGMISDVSADEHSKKVYIYDHSGRKIMMYNFLGEYLGQKINSDMWWRFEAIDDMYVVNPLNFSGKEPCMLKIIASKDSALCFKNSILYEQQGFFLVPDIKNFQKTGSELIFRQQFNDTVYQFNPIDKTLSVRYYFDFGNIAIPRNLLGNATIFDKEAPNYGYLHDVTENSQYIFATIFYLGKYERYAIAKKTGKSYMVKNRHLDIWPLWGNESGVLVTYMEADRLIAHQDELSDAALKNIASVLQEESNPVIVLIK